MVDRAPTKPNRYAVYDDEHNFLRYEYHERADEPTQVGDALNKANLLPDAVATALGLTGNPQVKDALNKLSLSSRPEQYVWDKYERGFVTEVNTVLQDVPVGAPESILDVYPSISVDNDTGEISGTGTATPVTLASNSPALRSKYFEIDGKWYRGREGSNTGNSDGIIYMPSHRVIAVRTGARLGQVASLASDAYPQSGSIGGYGYEYVGRPQYVEARIEIGSYVGTGTSGELNPTIIPTSLHNPKFLCINNSSVGEAPKIMPISFSKTYTKLYFDSSSFAFVKKEGGTVYLYGDDASKQANINNNVYRYIVIG